MTHGLRCPLLFVTPREAARALRYVLLNFAHHAQAWGETVAPTFLDPFSSIRYLAADPEEDAPVASPRTWLLRAGWLKAASPLAL